MATLTMTPTRQPLGCLNTMPLMRSKLNRQNQQNGAMSMKSMKSTPMKRSIFIDTNSENINPASFSTKRKRTFEDDEDSASKPIKTSRMALSARINISPRLSTPSKISITTPKSAPILKPAGRSPPPKSSKSATRRSLIAKPRPEQYTKRGVARPFSLASALAQSTTPKPAPAPKAPASWAFDIHVDTEQEEMTNLMQHSTTVLDISDDEGKSNPCPRGKENIPPHELGIDLPRVRHSTTTVPAAARKSPMMDEPRAPLGELNAAEYYPEGCNAFSYTIVYDDEENAPEFKKPSLPLSQSHQALITTSIASVLDGVTSRAADTRHQNHEDSTDSTKSAF
ncbi:uncharacterized protein N7479_005255 [Penicillium vulpinum]|uniref:Uncharacterized protein n=1 Tax=Penicillium vulpinum TaxID=29845 RepID=A0A1V6RI72_9EURO|nr:uncharacterized protein N7479_005255 [Penicillium vulpinum]KAJ5958105.1 hypothetical protein N7479_005255 [Penicillium vulpinum]OQE01240.1 hypothetical protein PENVUL_c043G04289 [Penicillium vulpinum]